MIVSDVQGTTTLWAPHFDKERTAAKIESVKRAAPIIGIIIFFAALGTFSYKGYESIVNLRSEVAALQQDTHQTKQLAERESVAATAASKRAEEAAARAEMAAAGRHQAEQQRQQAEEQKQQAELGRTQALTTAQQATERAKRSEDEVARMRREREEELNRMQEALNRVVETRRTPNGMVIVLPDSTFRFDFDSSELRQQNRELLSRIAGILLVSKGYGLAVYGYTDDVGTAEYNQKLSLRRAKAVEDYLVHSGLDASIMTIKGYGKTSPLVPGASASARAKNRRVEIALTDSSIRYGGEPPVQ